MIPTFPRSWGNFMRRKIIYILLFLCAAGACVYVGRPAIRRLYPQSDLRPSETPAEGDKHIVLVAARSSEFKEALAAKLRQSLLSDNIAVKIAGVGNLKQIDAKNYDAVIVMSACMAWGLDPEVQAFINRQARCANVIMVITSASGGWVPDKGGRDYDALSSASRMTSVDAVAGDIMARIKLRIKGSEPLLKSGN